MSESSQDVEIFQGEELDLAFTVTKQDGVTVEDISAASAINWFVGKNLRAPAVLEKTLGSGIEITDGAAGTLSVTLSEADTSGLDGTYEHELAITLGGRKVTVSTGAFVVKASGIR